MTITEINEKQESTQGEQTSSMLLHLDPRVLVAHPNNSRKKLTGIKELAASIKLVGLVQPLVVTEDEDGYRIIAGHRRAAASIEAGLPTVKCIVDSTWATSELAPLTAFVAENVSREGLSSAEEAEAYRQMSLLGMPVGDIAKAAGRRRKDVTQAIAVAENEVALAAAARHDLTFDQAAAIAEFAEDKEAVKALTDLAVRSPGSFDHRLSQLRQNRVRKAQYRELLDDLTQRGVTVIDQPDYGDKSVVAVDELFDQKGKALDAKKHEDCLGHVAAIELAYSGEMVVVAYCTRWKQNGHQLKPKATTGLSDEEKARRREVIDNNAAWRAAEPVRRQFVSDLCIRKSVPKGLLRYAITAALDSPKSFGGTKDSIFAELTKMENVKINPWGGPTFGHVLIEQTTDVRLPLALFAQVATSVESAMDVHTWRNCYGGSRESAYLSFLASQGYTLSDVERLVVGTDEQGDDDDTLSDPAEACSSENADTAADEVAVTGQEDDAA